MSRLTRWKGYCGASYVRLERHWAQIWPFKRGRGIFYRFRPVLYKAGILPAWVGLEAGVTLLLDPEDLVQRVLLLEGVWESQVWRGIAVHLREGAVFMDVGAHIGYYSLKAARLVGASGRVLSIEPNPPVRRLLEANIAANHATNVSIQSFAMSDRNSAAVLFHGPPGNTALASLAGAGQTVMVETRTMDDFVAEAGITRVDVVKIDVEGAELLVLRGATGTLSRLRPVLILELIGGNLGAMGVRVDEVHSFLRSAGYGPGRQLGETDWEFCPEPCAD